mgnify:CR=1 FL=1
MKRFLVQDNRRLLGKLVVVAGLIAFGVASVVPHRGARVEHAADAPHHVVGHAAASPQSLRLVHGFAPRVNATTLFPNRT